MQKTIESLIHNAISSFFPKDNHTPPLNLLSSSFISLGDESSRLSLIYEENEHFNNNFEDEQSMQIQSDIANLSQPAILQAINDANLYSKLTEVTNPSGLLFLAISPNEDSLFIQVTDHHIYITFTQSGQY